VIEAVVAPLLHRYEVAPDAVSVTEPPWQKVVGPLAAIETVGRAFTVIVLEAVAEHPFVFVPVTV
jgi:hypothetical protein